MLRNSKSIIRRVLSGRAGVVRTLGLLGAAGLFAVACDVHGISAPGTLASITVTPDATVAAGAGQQLVAVGRDAEGHVVTISPSWSVATGGGTINNSGMFTAGSALGVFSKTGTASVGSISGAATITVVAGPLASISLSPNPVTIGVTTTQQFVAVGKDAGGNVVPFTPTWSVLAGGGTIDQSGVFTAGTTPGSYAGTVQVANGSIKAVATVNVTAGPATSITVTPNPSTLAAGATQQFTAVGKDASGNVVPLNITWSVVSGGGTIDGGGLFTAGGSLGTFIGTVKATSGALSGNATVIVTTGALASIVVTPNPANLNPGAAQTFTAQGFDAAGNTVVISPTWAVVNGGGAIDAAGNFTAGAAAGTYTNTVRATSGNLSGFATVNVGSGLALATITVTPNPVTMSINGQQQFTAVGRDVNGNITAIQPTWTVVNGGGTIDANGLFKAGSTPGTYANTVQAKSGAITGTATVIETTGNLAQIIVTPNPANLAQGGTQQFTAVGVDNAGNPVAITPVWTVVNGGGTINATGNFTAGAVAGTFTNTVQATSGGISGNATVNVASGLALTTITVTPNPATMNTNSTQQFIATGRDQNGNPVLINPAVVWTVVNGGGTINSNGLFTSGLVAGTFTNTVKATSGAISGSATVIVNAVIPPPVSPLKSAANFGILAGSGISCAISGTVTGATGPADMGSSPTATISGFPPCTFTGSIPSPAVVATAKGDLTAAYLAAQGQVCNTVLTGFDLGFYDGSTPAKSLPPGTYCFASSAGLTGTLKLTGSATAKWTFQIGSTLTAEVSSKVILAGGAVPDNVYWAVGSSATIKTGAAFQGNIMSFASITLQNGTSLLGRALAQTGAVDLISGGTTIVKP